MVLPGEQPERVAEHKGGRVCGELVAEEGVATDLKLMLEHIAPLFLQPLHFVGGERGHSAMPREKVLSE